MGQATARVFVEAGCPTIALLDINDTGLEATKSILLKAAPESSAPPTVRTYKCDVTSTESVNTAYTQVHTDFGRIDYSIHCAGIVVYAAGTADLEVELFDRQIKVNLRGIFLCSQAALRIMRAQSLDHEVYTKANIPEYRAQRGAIVNFASSLAYRCIPNYPAYCAAKAGVLALTKSDALDYVREKIRVNAVAPGIIDTPMTNPTPEVRDYLMANVVDKLPMKRFGQPQEVAEVVLFLASNKAAYVTGTGLPIDGGHLLQV
jgi:NAD(P)-dependent dehydrogenase (short-subunit alcohol dehydrogenase family)